LISSHIISFVKTVKNILDHPTFGLSHAQRSNAVVRRLE
jgi:hypothetical protein